MGLRRRNDPMHAGEAGPGTESIAEAREQRGVWARIVIAISRLFHPVYRTLFTGRGHLVSRLEKRLAQANVSTPVELYLSNAIGIGAVAGATVGSLIGTLVAILIGGPGAVSLQWLQPSVVDLGTTGLLVVHGLLTGLIILAWLVVSALAGLFIALLIAFQYPVVVAYRRRREIETMLPDVVGFMYSLSVGGMDTLAVFRAVADAEDTYGEIAVEFQQITHDIEYFNTDYQTAVEDAARTSPSQDLSKFLIDLLSVINSGGDVTAYLETQKDHQIEERRRNQEDLLNTLEVFGEVYISLTVLPLILLVILVIMALLGDAQVLLLVVTVYCVLPLLNGLYFMAISSTIQESVGTGELEPTNEAIAATDHSTSLTTLGVVDSHVQASPTVSLLHRIRAEEFRHRLSRALANPLSFFRRSPRHSLAVTLPVTLLVLGILLAEGIADPSSTAMEQSTLTQSFVWFGLPLFLIGLPIALFAEWRSRALGSITDTLTADLRKLANANATGQPLLEAIRITGEDNDSRLGRELTTMYKRVTFGSSLGTVLVEFNNRYRLPRLARSVKLIQKAQETSDHITDVLTTAAELSEIQDALEREKRSRTRMQVAIIIISFVVFVGVLLMLEEFFIETIVEVMSEDSDGELIDFGTVEPAFLSMLYLHAALIQGCCAGLICGYVQSGDLYPGLKYALGLVGLTFVAWAAVGVMV